MSRDDFEEVRYVLDSQSKFDVDFDGSDYVMKKDGFLPLVIGSLDSDFYDLYANMCECEAMIENEMRKYDITY